MGFMNFSFVMAGIGQIASVIKSGIEVIIFPLQENETILFVKIFSHNNIICGIRLKFGQILIGCTHPRTLTHILQVKDKCYFYK